MRVAVVVVVVVLCVAVRVSMVVVRAVCVGLPGGGGCGVIVPMMPVIMVPMIVPMIAHSLDNAALKSMQVILSALVP